MENKKRLIKTFNEYNERKQTFIEKGDYFISKHLHIIKGLKVKDGDEVEIIEVYRKTADIKINGKLVTNVKFDDIGEIKYLLYKDY